MGCDTVTLSDCDTMTNRQNRWAIRLRMEQYFGHSYWSIIK